MYRMPDVTVIPYLEHDPQIAADTFVASGARIIGKVTLGAQANIWFNVTMRGDVHSIEIGNRTNIQDNSVIHVTTNGHPTIVGQSVTVGHHATLHACTVEDYALVGMGAVILDGCTIGRYSMVGAGSVCPPEKKYPDHSLILGSPATVKRKLTDKEIEYLIWSADHYVKLGEEYRTHCI
ncbi:MAG: gamma carbonic anhydrase family protein [Zetaproteobacteria bacterium]|nr:gamma carbonic anhydrase family protein [Zetaproteobacteria bacterium]